MCPVSHAADPPDPSCSICSKPVRAGAPIRFQHGEVFHLACLAKATQLNAMEQVDRARVAQAASARLLDDSGRARAERRREFRALKLEAWYTTSEGGRVLRASSVRPDRPT